MGVSTKKMGSNWANTAGKRKGMGQGAAPAPGHPGGSSRGKVHDAGYSYAEFAKSDPATFGQGKGKGGRKS